MRRKRQPRSSIKTFQTVLRRAEALTCSFSCVFLIAFFLCAGKGRAAGGAEVNLPQGDMGLASLKMGAALLLVIGVIFGLYYLSRKIRDGRFSLNRYSAMRVIGSLSLAPKRSIALVEVCDEWLVLGIGTESITLLRRIEDPPVKNSEAITPTGGGTSGSFQSLLRRKIKRPTTGNSSTREKDGTPG